VKTIFLCDVSIFRTLCLNLQKVEKVTAYAIRGAKFIYYFIYGEWDIAEKNEFTRPSFYAESDDPKRTHNNGRTHWALG